MQKRREMDWVGYVLQDVVAFLAENQMMQSAQMLAVAAAHIDHDMKNVKPAQQSTAEMPANLVSFPRQKRPLP